MSMTTSELRREAFARKDEMARTVPLSLVRAEGDDEDEPGDGNTLDGYASVFGVETIIRSWEGRFKERFLSGSMKRSFRDSPPIIQFDHGSHPLVGSLPIARLEPGFPREESHPELAPDGGAHVVARMHEDPLFGPVREVISTGTVNGMSIRFNATREQWFWPDGSKVKDDAQLEAELYRTWREDVPDEELLRRDILECLVPEMGPVVWPAYRQTSVGVRAVDLLVRQHPTDIPVAPVARSAGDEETDAERQAAEASASKKRRAAQMRALSLRGL